MRSVYKACFALVVALLAIGVGTAQGYANTVTYQSEAAFQLEPFRLAHTLDVNEFDPGLGMLTKAKLTLTGNLSGYVSISNHSSDERDVSVTFYRTVEVFDATGQPLGAGTSDNRTETYHLMASAGVNFDQMPRPYAYDEIYVEPLELASLVGSESLEFTIEGYSWATGTDLITDVQTNDWFTVNASIEYEYTPVPIPGGVWLLASGLVGFKVLRRRLQRHT